MVPGSSEKTSSKDKTYKEYTGYHELFNELDKEQVLSDVVGWLDKHLA